MKKFDDDLRVAVLTSKYVFNENKPILPVFHHEVDGMWEFIFDQEANEEDYLTVALEEFISLDLTILEIADLPYGKEAYRNAKNSPWLIRNSEQIGNTLKWLASRIAARNLSTV